MNAHEIVRGVYCPGVPTADLVEECLAQADAEALREAAEVGFADLVAHYEHASWREANGGGEEKPATRSGHQNASGRFAGVRQLRGRGILSIGVHLNDGTAYKLGEMDLDAVEQWREEFLGRVRGNRVGADFADRLAREMERRKKHLVGQLGERRVSEIRKATGFRVRRPHSAAEDEAA